MNGKVSKNDAIKTLHMLFVLVVAPDPDFYSPFLDLLDKTIYVGMFS